jgi:two-component sensor histidine kinase
VLKRLASSPALRRADKLAGSAARFGRLASAHRAAGFLLALVLIVLILFMMRLEWRRVFDEARATTSTVAQILADNSDLLLESADLVRVQVSEIVGAEDPPAGDFDTFQQLRNLVEASPHLVSVWVGDEHGRAVLTSRQYPTPDLNAADRDYFRAVKDEPDRLFVGPLVDNRFANQILISTSRRLSHADGSFRGFVQIALDPEHIRNTFQQVRLPFPASLWWIGPDDVPLLREPAVSEEVLTTEGRKFAQYAGVSSGSSFHGLGIDGSPKTFTAATSLRYGSRIIVGVADGDLRALWWKRVYPTMAFGFLLVLSLLTIFAFSRREGVRALRYAAQLEREVRERTVDLDAAVQQKDLVLREMRHRVANGFATIQALARLMLRSTKDLASFERDFPDRLAAMAATQVLITESDRQGSASLHDLVRREISPYRAESLDRTVVEGPPIQLQSSQAVGLGLILHELTTNAVKYGALSTAEGRLSVRWSIDEEGKLDARLARGGRSGRSLLRQGAGSGPRFWSAPPPCAEAGWRSSFAPEGVRVTVRLPADPSAWVVG